MSESEERKQQSPALRAKTRLLLLSLPSWFRAVHWLLWPMFGQALAKFPQETTTRRRRRDPCLLVFLSASACSALGVFSLSYLSSASFRRTQMIFYKQQAREMLLLLREKL